MQMLYDELAVLARAVHFKNLSAAAMHVGLSQPQLSRIIAKLEDRLKVVLLDRSAKRKSGWTPVAYQIAGIFEKSSKKLEQEILATSNEQMVGELRIGSLEGLAPLAMKTAQACFEKIGVRRISLDVFDLSELEAHFMSGDLDLIFTSHAPGKQKFKHLEEIGHQKLDQIESNPRFHVYSSFEFHRLPRKEVESSPFVLISNSLAIKKEWFKHYGGTGVLPSEPRRGKAKDQEQVYLIGTEVLSPLLWDKIVSLVEV